MNLYSRACNKYSRQCAIQVNAARNLHHEGMLDPQSRGELWEDEAVHNPVGARSLFAQELGRLCTMWVFDGFFVSFRLFESSSG